MKRILKMVLPLIGRFGYFKYILLGILSGLLNFLFVNQVTRIIGVIINGKFTSMSSEYVLAFASLILTIVWTRKTLSSAIIKLSQQVFWRLRKHILSLILKANYEQLTSRKVLIHSIILGDVAILTDASMSIIGFSVAAVLSVSCLIYLASISFILFLITLAFALLGSGFYYFRSKRNNEDFEKARRLENTFSATLDTILNGFKEIYMEPKKGKDIYDNTVITNADMAYKNNVAAYTGFLHNQITGQVLFYILISTILLTFGTVLNVNASSLVSFVFTLLYLLGSLETIMVLLPNLMRARVAATHLLDLINDLEQAHFSNPIPERAVSIDEFENIKINDLKFSYNTDEKSFGVGPISFNISKGDIIFIYGGNGSGKTTFIHSLLGLRIPSSGEIRMNGNLITDEIYPFYRTLFSVVFSDFYLFKELFGVEKVNIQKWKYYLDLFELGDKVQIDGKKFTTTNLSTGQRKRLALIAGLLEEKPILVLDEWAADQDPYFRKKFYTEILPILKNNGLTVVAITHDDKYYHCADKLFKMEYGTLVEEDTKSMQIDIQFS